MSINPSILQNQWLTIPILIWSLYWKGRALWKAAKRDEKYWFVGLLVVNTVGLLEIAYIFYFARWKNKIASESVKN